MPETLPPLQFFQLSPKSQSLLCFPGLFWVIDFPLFISHCAERSRSGHHDLVAGGDAFGEDSSLSCPPLLQTGDWDTHSPGNSLTTVEALGGSTVGRSENIRSSSLLPQRSPAAVRGEDSNCRSSFSLGPTQGLEPRAWMKSLQGGCLHVGLLRATICTSSSGHILKLIKMNLNVLKTSSQNSMRWVGKDGTAQPGEESTVSGFGCLDCCKWERNQTYKAGALKQRSELLDLEGESVGLSTFHFNESQSFITSGTTTCKFLEVPFALQFLKSSEDECRALSDNLTASVDIISFLVCYEIF